VAIALYGTAAFCATASPDPIFAKDDMGRCHDKPAEWVLKRHRDRPQPITAPTKGLQNSAFGKRRHLISANQKMVDQTHVE
jgi:hypothetical protein